MNENIQNPLIPMSEMFSSSTTESKDVRQKSGQPPSSTKDLIDIELETLTTVQTSNNEEIKKRLTDIQSLRENNLVVIGAIGVLKKLKKNL